MIGRAIVCLSASLLCFHASIFRPDCAGMDAVFISGTVESFPFCAFADRLSMEVMLPWGRFCGSGGGLFPTEDALISIGIVAGDRLVTSIRSNRGSASLELFFGSTVVRWGGDRGTLVNAFRPSRRMFSMYDILSAVVDPVSSGLPIWCCARSSASELARVRRGTTA